MRLEKRADKCIALLFAAFLAVFFALNLFLPDRDFSEKENRYLQTFPAFSLPRLFGGQFTSQAESWCADQFVGRDRWISLKARCELLLGKKENNGVFLCEGERLLEPFAAPDSTALERRISAVNAFTENAGVPVTLALIPSPGEIYGYLLPYGAQKDRQQDTIENIYAAVESDTADLLSPLNAHRDEYIYYRTDHHWTSLGAYYAGRALADSLGFTPHDREYYHPRTVSEDFLGTAYSSSGFFWVGPDSMEAFTEEAPELRVTRYDGEKTEESSLYVPKMLESKDKYRYFLGGNSPRVVIDTGSEGLPSLLLIRDSYADALVPFLTEHYSSIHLLDLRYYLDPVSEYVRENGIDRVLILYSVDDFCTENLALLAR